MFRDRKDAGEKLALALEAYKNNNAHVLAIPRGGVLVGSYVAKYLNAELSILVVRKLPFPDNPEAGFGAIAEDGTTFLIENVSDLLSSDTMKKIIEEQTAEVKRRINIYRKGKPLPGIKNKTVILVDDGIAMGSTMFAAILFCKKQNAAKIIVASPVAAPSVTDEMAQVADDVIILEKPPFFRAVAQVYANWYDVPDYEVIRTINMWEKQLTKETKND